MEQLFYVLQGLHFCNFEVIPFYLFAKLILHYFSKQLRHENDGRLPGSEHETNERLPRSFLKISFCFAMTSSKTPRNDVH